MSSLVKQSRGFVGMKTEGGQADALFNLSQHEVGGGLTKTVGARELHEFLEVRTRFNDWFANRVKEYGFIENVDYVSFTKNLVKPSGGRPSIEYFITLDMAKELSMVERNEKGKLARQYFIDCERQAKELANRDPMGMLNDPSALRQALLGYSEKVIALEAKVEEQAPKVQALERISADESTLTVTEAAKVLGVKVRQLTDWMNANGWVYRMNGSWVAYQRQITVGRLVYKEAKYTDANTGMEVRKPYCHITSKGLVELAKQLNKDIAPNEEICPLTLAS